MYEFMNNDNPAPELPVLFRKILFPSNITLVWKARIATALLSKNAQLVNEILT